MDRGLAKLVKLTWRERWWLAQSLVLLPASALALRVTSPHELESRVQHQCWQPSSPPADAARIAHMVAAAAHYGPYRATCLPQSLVLLWLLRRNGLSGELRYGVRKMNGTVTAHSWVEHNGEPLIDSRDVTSAFATLEPSAPAARWDR